MKRWSGRLQRAAEGRQAKVFFWASLSLPLVVLAVLVAAFAVNVPFLDQWELVDLFAKYHGGELGLGDFFAQHNEHRIVFPRLLMFGLAAVSHWNVVLEMAASLLIAGVSAVFLYKLLVRTIMSRRLLWLAALSLGFVFFSPLAWENWLWGWQIQWYLNVLGLVVAVWALAAWHASPHKRLLLAGAMAVLATYSLASGFFVWLVCVPIIWTDKSLRRGLWAWLAAACAAVMLHYVGYNDPANHPAKTLFLDQPLEFITYLSAYIVHPVMVWFGAVIPMVLIYMAVFAAALWCIWQKARALLSHELLPWLCLGLYGALAAVSTAITRLGFGAEQAFSSRYATLSQLIFIAFCVTLYKIIELQLGKPDKKDKRIRLAAAGALVFFLGWAAANYGKGVWHMYEHHNYMQAARHCAQTAASLNDQCLYRLYPLPDVTWQRLQYLRSIHWGGL